MVGLEVLGEVEDSSVERQPAQILIAAAVFAEQQRVLRRNGEVVGKIELRDAGRFEDEGQRSTVILRPELPDLSAAGVSAAGRRKVDGAVPPPAPFEPREARAPTSQSPD